MSNSKNLSSTSPGELVQMPLKGFHMELKSPKPGWKLLVEGMGDERVRYKMTKIKK